MGTVTIKYQTRKRKQKKVFDSDVKVIDLADREMMSIDLNPLVNCTSLQKLVFEDNQLQEIDLSPLASCTSLQELHLSNNQLQEIDLSPLAGCTSLQELSINENQLQEIGLSPLAMCTNLKILWLYGNKFKEIDLSPLAVCTNLQDLNLSNNQLQEIDLSPLASCTSLQKLGLFFNQLQEIDLTPLASCTSLQLLVISENQLQEIDLSPLASCTSLQRLGINDNQFQEVDLSPLVSCHDLISVDLDKDTRAVMDSRYMDDSDLPKAIEIALQDKSYKINTDKILKVLCKRVKNYEGLEWLEEFTGFDFFSFEPESAPTGEVLTRQIGPWFIFVVNITYEGTTEDPSTDRLSGDPYSAMVSYDWIGPKDTLPARISSPKGLDKWATFKTWYSREYTALGSRGIHRGSWVTGIDEDGTVYLREADGWFLDVSPESMTTEKTINLELPKN